MSPFNRNNSRPRNGGSFNHGDRPPFRDHGDRPPFRRDDDGGRPFRGHREDGDRPRFNRDGDRPFRDRPPFRDHGDRPPFRRDDDGVRPFRGHREDGDRPRFNRDGDRPFRDRPPFRDHGDRPPFRRDDDGGRPFRGHREDGDRPRFNRDGDRPFRDRPPRDGFRPSRVPPKPIVPVEPVAPFEWTEESVITISCARGLPVYAAQEAKALGLEPTAISDTTVVLRGNFRDAMMLNLWSRTATRILWRVGHGRAEDITGLYEVVNSLPWESYIPEDGYFTVNNFTHQDTIRDTRLPSLCVKDAIADRFRAACNGRRPNSGGDFSGAAVYLWWQDNRVELYIDTTGESLSKRGYRLQPWKAPMQESLAAACVAASGWDPTTPFVAPMCGSGTPAIEAAMVAINRAPGILRDHFCFMSLRNYAENGMAAEWEELKKRAIEQERRDDVPAIIATDIAEDAIEAAKANANRAGVLDLIKFDVCDFAETEVPPGPGTIFMNPEYGERMGEVNELLNTYARIGEFLKQKGSAYCAAVLTGNLDLARKIGLHSLKRLVFNNGPIDCRLLMFQL